MSEKLKQLTEKAFETNDFKELREYFETEEYRNLPYLVRNSGFITSHKLLDFMRCQFCYAQKYINLRPDPTEGDNDAFLVGGAFDERLTYGETAYKNSYEVVARRSKEATKKQLTQLQGSLIDQMRNEFLEQKMFNPNPKKQIEFCKLGGFILKAELDDIDTKNRIIVDMKTCANITNFNPQNYLHQMSFYQLVIEEALGVRCSANLEVVDKYAHFSRSGLFHFSEISLFANRGALLTVLDEMKSAHESGIFQPATRQEVLYECPYYGLKTNSQPYGHGRPQKPIIY